MHGGGLPSPETSQLPLTSNCSILSPNTLCGTCARISSMSGHSSAPGEADLRLSSDAGPG